MMRVVKIVVRSIVQEIKLKKEAGTGIIYTFESWMKGTFLEDLKLFYK